MNFQEQISDQEIERSLWLIENKSRLKRIIIIVLLIINLSLYGFSLFKFINIKIQDKQQKNSNLVSIDFSSWQERNKIKKLIVVSKNIIPLGNNSYDIVIEIKNPNERVAVKKLNYKFLYNDQTSSEQTSFLLPNETKKLIDFNVKSNKMIRSVNIEIINIDWQRLKIPELEKVKRKIFTISDQKIHFNNQNDSARNWIEFKAFNESPYSWRNSEFYVSLYLGSKLIAINKIKTEKFYSQEEKHLKTSWFQKMPSYLSLKIESEVNLLNPNNYLKP